MRNLLGVLATFLLAGSALAAPPIETYGRLPAIDFIELSQSGERFALVARVGENRRLFVRKADGQAELVTNLEPGKVRDIEWGGDRHLFVFGSTTINAPLDGLSTQEWWGGAHLDLQTRKAFPLLLNSNVFTHAVFGWYGVRDIGGRSYAYVGALTQEDLAPRLVMEGNSGSFSVYPKLIRIDLETGKPDFVVRNIRGDSEWVVGDDGEVLLTWERDPKGEVYRLYRGRGGVPAVVSRIEDTSTLELEGRGRTADSVLLKEESDETFILKEVVPGSDGAGVVLSRDDNTAKGIYDRTTHLLIGIRSKSGARIELFDPALQRRVDAARKAFPGLRSSLVSFGQGFDHMIFLTDGPNDSGTYWLVDIPKRSAVPIGRVYPDIGDNDVGLSRSIDYKAADGLAMDGVLTLPPGKEPRNLPLVVLPHGGPITPGDEPGFDWWAQAFASQGYAVFQPNYRGTLGRGVAFRKAASGEFGRKMQSDLSDGVKALAAQGIVNPARACIVGGSYGGYAALAGVTVEQGRYRCSVAVAGLSDLAQFQNWVDGRSGSDRGTRAFWKDLMGATGGQDLAAISPARLAARADAPILLIHGDDDSVVPIEQSRMMERALKAAGKPVEFVTLPGEDHWLSSEPTRQAMLKAAVAFVEKYNPSAP